MLTCIPYAFHFLHYTDTKRDSDTLMRSASPALGSIIRFACQELALNGRSKLWAGILQAVGKPWAILPKFYKFGENIASSNIRYPGEFPPKLCQNKAHSGGYIPRAKAYMIDLRYCIPSKGHGEELSLRQLCSQIANWASIS